MVPCGTARRARPASGARRDILEPTSIFRESYPPSVQEPIVKRAPSSSATETPPADEPIATQQAFSRFVRRVTGCAARWSARLSLDPAVDCDDVLQSALVHAYRRRASYEPALGSWEQWFYAFFMGEVRNHRRTSRRRKRHVDLAEGDLPEMVDLSSPEERTLMRRLLETSCESLDPEIVAIVMARDIDGMAMSAIAAAHNLPLSTAYSYYNRGKKHLRRALEQDRARKRALGLAVLPITVDQLLASEGEPPGIPEDTMRRIWADLDRRMAADMAAGLLGDDGTTVERYMGTPGAALRPGRLARLARALFAPGVSHAICGAVGAAVMYVTVAGAPSARPVHALEEADLSRAVRAMRTGAPDVALPATAAPAPVSAPDTSAAPPASAAPDRDFSQETRLVNKASAAYEDHDYAGAIRVLQQHAARFPHGILSGAREKLFMHALLDSGHVEEARARLERLRQTNPTSPILREFDALVPPDQAQRP